MKKTIFIFFFIFISICNNILSQSKNEFLIQPSRNNIIQNNENVLLFYKQNNLSLINNYIVYDSCFEKFGQKVQKLNEVYLFDSNNHKVVFYEGIKCANNSFLLSNTNIEKLHKTDNSVFFDSLLSFIYPISPIEIQKTKYTAFLIWNKSIGIKNEDNFINWENILKNKFGNEITILKINYDCNKNYRDHYKNKISDMFNGILNYYYSKVDN